MMSSIPQGSVSASVTPLPYHGAPRVNLTQLAHQHAEHLSMYCSDYSKAEQVYLNILAVSAVNEYLQEQGFKTNLQGGDSYDPVMNIFLNVADLAVINYGRVECRPVEPSAEYVHIPTDVWSDRIGFVAVQLNPSLTQATLLGFINEVSIKEFPLLELKSINTFSSYLHTLNSRISLSEWRENSVISSWKNVDKLLENQHTNALVFAYKLGLYQLSSPPIEKAKFVALGNYTSILRLCAIPKEKQRMEIFVGLHPVPEQKYLIQNIKFSLLSASENILWEVISRSNDDFITLSFAGNVGEQFSISVALGDYNFEESFQL